METTRLLLPFTHGVSVEAIEHAVMLAKSYQAELVALALVYVPEEHWAKGARLEHIQQSKDFLEVTKHKAARHSVPVERFEVFTGDAVRSMNVLVHELKCDGMLLFVDGDRAVLLQAKEIQQLIKTSVCRLYVVHNPLHSQPASSRGLFNIFSRLYGRRSTEQSELLSLLSELGANDPQTAISGQREMPEVSRA